MQRNSISTWLSPKGITITSTAAKYERTANTMNLNDVTQARNAEVMEIDRNSI